MGGREAWGWMSWGVGAQEEQGQKLGRRGGGAASYLTETNFNKTKKQSSTERLTPLVAHLWIDLVENLCVALSQRDVKIPPRKQRLQHHLVDIPSTACLDLG